MLKLTQKVIDSNYSDNRRIPAEIEVLQKRYELPIIVINTFITIVVYCCLSTHIWFIIFIITW